MSDGCVFCDIFAKKTPADIVKAWPDAMVIRPLHPVTEGHVLVIPRAHVADFAENPAKSSQVMRRAAEYIGPDRTCDYNIITSVGPAATQTVFHLHVHVVPRYAGDGLALPWPDS